ncbi:translation initiation factor [Dichomitus squalens]|uniref:Translation initiation factor n=2 Tax=Dichomitus squalens TaxID=114155 RepID=A0A4Q9PAP1_9APHY|nr:translation initiation factor [Dichomitus squalens LYAD-421 SS1]EJF55714.1 translation initiation factor [Dichomitus squalens LYAD-421 SS1]TBU37671.1 translation initiation factor [Dichomitus squalens]TBU51528.1 translation initiation factor [Dichomitus squalens]
MASAGVVNIRRDVDDKFYRYRMPVLTTKIEGKGNGIKTVLPNMSDVARALSRPPTYPTKFFGCELGAQTSFDEKNDRYIVNGAHDATKLRELLDVFIEKFVLCKACKNPETDLIITKTEEIIRDCKACGERTGVDMRHKLTTFIVKNPPKNPKKSKSKKGSGDSPTPNGTHATAPENGDVEDDVGAESDDELTKRIKADAAKLNDESAIAKEDWSQDTSPEAVKARLKAVEASMASVALAVGGDDDSEEDADSPYAQLGHWIEENRDAGAVEIYKKADEFGIAKKHNSLTVIAQTLFTENVVAEIEKYAPLFVKMVTSEKHQKSLLGGIERLVGIEHPDLIPVVPKILMAFYQVDVLDEEVVKQWGTHVSKKYVDRDTSKKVRKASEPFLKWLDEADDSDEDDE